jgi:hypothetical protein
MLRLPLRAAALATGSIVGGVLLLASVARAQPPGPTAPDALASARALFAEALRDEEAGRYGEALTKFERVRAVRDTASIEFRIGSCHEGLGEPVPAYRAYLAAKTLGATDPQGTDVSHAASDRLDALARHLARLTLIMPNPAPTDAQVWVDDGAAGTQDPIPLAPGRHVVTATAGGAAPFRSEIALAEGAQVALTVTLQPPPAPQPIEPQPPPPAPPPEKDTLAPVRWLTVGGGVGLMAVSAVLLVARHNDISDLNRACMTMTGCPRDQQSELESTRQQALVLGPWGVACGVAGIALAGAGIYWIVTAHRPAAAGPAVSVVPMIGLESAGLALTGPLR